MQQQRLELTALQPRGQRKYATRLSKRFRLRLAQ